MQNTYYINLLKQFFKIEKFIGVEIKTGNFTFINEVPESKMPQIKTAAKRKSNGHQ
jgi:hypothetical protein